MEHVKVRLNKYLERLKNIKLLKIYQNPDLNEMFWFICILSGFLRARKVNRTFKRIWYTFLILSISLSVLLNFYGFLHGKEKNLHSMLNLFRSISIVFATIVCYFVFAYFYESIETYIKELDEYLNTLSNHEDEERYSRRNQFSSVVPIILICVVLWLKGHELYFPLFEVNGNQSKIRSFLLLFAMVFITLPSTIFIIGGERMKQIYIKQMILAFGELQRQIRMSSEATLENLESSHNEELAIEKKNPEQRNRVAYLFNRRRNAIYKNFDENMVYFAKKHKKLVKIHLHVKTFLEFILSMSIVQTSTILVIFGSDLLQTLYHHNMMSSWTVTELVCLTLLIRNISEYCLIAVTFNDVLESISYEVYCCPWYLFPKNHRKMVLLWLTQCQIPHGFRVFGTFPLDMTFMPKVLDLIYSYVSVLHIVLERSK